MAEKMWYNVHRVKNYSEINYLGVEMKNKEVWEEGEIEDERI